MEINSLNTKLKHAFRIDRAIRFVWQAAPLYTVLSSIMVVILGVLPLVSLYLIKLIVDETSQLIFSRTSSSPDLSIIWIYVSIACATGLFTIFFNCLSDYLKKAQSLAVTDHIFGVIHQKSAEADLELYECPENRDMLYRAKVEGPYRPTSIVRGLFTAGQSAAAFIAVAWLLMMLHPVLPAVMIIAAIPGVLIRLKYSEKIYDWQQKRTEDERKAYYFHNMLTGENHAKEFRLFNLSQHFIHQFTAIRNVLRKEKLWFEKRRAAGDMIAQSSSTIAVFGSFAYIIFQTVNGTITIGDMVMYFQAFSRGLGDLKTLMESAAQMYEDNLFLSYLDDFLKTDPRVIAPEKPVTIPSARVQGIKFKDVDFFYPNCGKKVLNCVNFSIRPGEIVALVGENGSGKSTIVKLLSRLYDPHEGQILLEDENIKNFDPDKYRKTISVVFQDHVHYYLSAKENISTGNIEQKNNIAKITQAATQSGIHDIIDTLPQGYDTPLGKMFTDGQELSIGQWQMLAIARAFFRESDLVILDEPSSALDPEAEMKIFTRIRQLIQGKSALIISHRYSSVKMADKILVMDNGYIIEQGTHSELLALQGKYATLYRTQADNYAHEPENDVFCQNKSV
ncbi:MAG: ABC transporter ATP-binding protein/permease [Proteobacteria bacterium]|nr:ABC transporter ATP-binding protein/permease [Pseudomonadota bacterium]MBU1388051.1 ABC transporter ATP-binding protein/permease [Pseudomonadota bacterium]MBU1542114.1 ABC transporter ATP-binding protein/permease [Pseudomonadota bacterium]MBU2482378.1 ABC transporter ATP-binding protein/permease [Pseudomonadota bacterium]